MHQRWAELLACGEKASLAFQRQFYDKVAVQPLFGMVHSQKRPIILDTATALTALVGHLDVRGRVLDIGCNGGYHALWLAHLPQIEHVHGIDISPQSIRLAREVGRSLGLTPARASFDASAFPCPVSAAPFDMVYCADGGFVFDGARGFAPISALVAEGGVVVLVCLPEDLADVDWAAALNAGLGFAFADVVGGWTGATYDERSLLVFVKGGHDPVPPAILDEADSMWPSFAQYANSGIPAAEKNQTFARSRSSFGEASD